MKAEAVLVRDLLSGRVTYAIPNFQRRYRWQREQWTLLFDDVCREAERLDSEKDGHFLGSIVLFKGSAPVGSGVTEWTVIDGQQRITSILLFLAALRDAFQFAGDLLKPSQIDDQLLSISGINQTTVERLAPTPLDKTQFIKTLRERTPSGRFGEGYDYFLKLSLQYRHPSGRPLEELLEALLNRLLVVRIEVENKDSINSIFNTLNSKGLPLNAGDLIKNELLLKFDDKTAQKVYIDKWAPIEDYLVSDIRGKVDDRKLITFFWARELRFSRNVTQKNLFTVFEERYRKSLDSHGQDQGHEHAAHAEIEDIWLNFENYRMIEDRRFIGQKLSAQLRDQLRFFKDWGSPIPIPIVLWILGSYRTHPELITEDEASKALAMLQSFLVRRSLCGYPSNNLNRLLSSIPYTLEQEITKSSTAQPLSQVLANILNKPAFEWPSDATVLQQISTVPLLKSVKLGQARAILELALRVETRSRSKLLTLLPKNVRTDELSELVSSPDRLDEATQVLPFTLGNLFLPGAFADNGSIQQKCTKAFPNAIHTSGLDVQIKKRSIELAHALLEELVYIEASPERPSDADTEDKILNILEIIPERSWTALETLSAVARCTAEEALSKLSSFPAYHVRFIRESNGQVLNAIPPELAAHVKHEDISAQSVFNPKNFLSEEDLYLLLEEAEENSP